MSRQAEAELAKLAREEVMLMKRSTEAGKKDPIEQVLDIVGPCLGDLPEFCLTDLNIRVGKDPEDIYRAAFEIIRRVQRELARKKRE